MRTCLQRLRVLECIPVCECVYVRVLYTCELEMFAWGNAQDHNGVCF